MEGSRTPIVAVVGRPNVGKSTLVNRILGRRAAVVAAMPGVTRDRREFRAEWGGHDFLIVDTGGWVVTPGDELAADVSTQAEAAMKAADLVLFVVDARAGITEDDAAVAELLRRSAAEVLVVVNKIDDSTQDHLLAEFWKLGLGEPIAVSSLHGRGAGELLDLIVGRLGEPGPDLPETAPARLALVGRPNVGKSTLLNRLVGAERVLVSATPGTTRDPVDAVVELDGTQYRVVDTAGIRRPPKTRDADYYSVLRARKALSEADVAVLIIDGTEGVTHQDQRIAEAIAESGVGLVVLLNKWDIADQDQKEETVLGVSDRLGFVGWAPVLRGSALTGSRLHRLPGLLEMVLEHRGWRIPTGKLNRLIREWTDAHPPPVRKGKRPKVLYAVQAGTEPPTLVLFVGRGDLSVDYLRFVENRLRGIFPLEGTPIRIVTRRRSAVHA